MKNLRIFFGNSRKFFEKLKILAKFLEIPAEIGKFWKKIELEKMENLRIFAKISDFLKFVCYILQHISITSIPNLDFSVDIETSRAVRKLLPSMCYIEY